MSALNIAPGQGSTLPAVLTPVLGREVELDQVQDLLDDATRRLVTLTGPGGVGKTRLALHVARTLVDEFMRDVIFVPLAAIRDPNLVLPTIGQAIGLSMDTGEAHDERLVSILRDRTPLLVLDNFEHLLDAAPAIAAVLAQSPGTKMLVTSQAQLGITGEQVYPLLPLPTPSVSQTTARAILHSDAVALFVARARAVKPTLVIDDRTAITIAEICRRLDGLPLAIELAAARITILSPDTLLARLGNRLQVLGGERRGVPDRLRTMRHAIAWSYDLLSPDEQALFRRLSVLAGGFSLDTVEAMSRGLNDGRGAIDVLSALVDHSLVQGIPAPSGENRFLILETLRAYGLEQLALLGEEPEAQLANATYFRDIAETAEPHLTGRGQEAWLNRLDAEWENIRATVDWALDSGHAEIVLRIFGAIWRFCSVRGHTTESRAFLDQALAATTDDQTTRRTRALVGAGYLAEDQRDLDIAQAYFMQARDLALRIGSETDQVRSLIGMGFVAHDRGDYATAMTFHTQVADLARSINDRRSLASAFSSMGAVSYFQGDLDEAVRNWEEARQIVMALGDHMAEATVSGNLGSVAMAQGEFERAVWLQRRALELHRQLDNKPDIAFCLINLAEQLRHLGDYAGANELLAEGIPLLRELGYKGTEGMGLNIHASLALAEGDDVRSASLVLESTRLFAEVGDQLSIAENADLLAEICAARGDHVTAIELMAASATIRADLGSYPTPLKLQQLKAIDDRIRQVVTEADYARHWQAGAGLDLDALVRRIMIVAREIVGHQQPQPLFPEPATSETPHNLTNRELQILRLLTQGQSTREISDTLFISPRTTTTHINNIFGKLEVSSRAAAVAYAMRNGLG